MKKIDPNTGLEITAKDLLAGVGNDGVSNVQQNGKDEADINLIVARAIRGADISHLSKGAPMYLDLAGLPDYRSSLMMVNKAREMFMTLDAQVRERFGNDPGKLLDFLGDDKNRDEAVKLGLVKAPEPPKPEDPVLGELKGLRKDLSDSKSKKRSAGDEE